MFNSIKHFTANTSLSLASFSTVVFLGAISTSREHPAPTVCSRQLHCVQQGIHQLPQRLQQVLAATEGTRHWSDSPRRSDSPPRADSPHGTALQTGSQLTLDPPYWPSTSTGASAASLPSQECRRCSVASLWISGSPRTTKRGLQGLLLYPVLGWSPPPTRLARPVAVYWPLNPQAKSLEETEASI